MSDNGAGVVARLNEKHYSFRRRRKNMRANTKWLKCVRIVAKSGEPIDEDSKEASSDGEENMDN